MADEDSGRGCLSEYEQFIEVFLSGRKNEGRMKGKARKVRASEGELKSRHVLHAWTLRSLQIIIPPMAFSRSLSLLHTLIHPPC